MRGPVLWLQQQNTGKTRKLHRSKVKIVDPNIAWDDITPRPKRDQPKRDPLRRVRFAHFPALDHVPEESDEYGVIEIMPPTRVTDSQVETDMDATLPSTSSRPSSPEIEDILFEQSLSFYNGCFAL